MNNHDWGVCGCVQVYEGAKPVGWFYEMRFITGPTPDACELCGLTFTRSEAIPAGRTPEEQQSRHQPE